MCDRLQVQYKEASRFRAAASAAAAGAGSGLNEADRAYRQMVSDPSSSVHPMLRCLIFALDLPNNTYYKHILLHMLKTIIAYCLESKLSRTRQPHSSQI